MSSLPLEMGFTWAVITLDKTVATGTSEVSESNVVAV